MRVFNNQLLSSTDVALTQNSSAVDLDDSIVADITTKITVNNPSNQTFTDADVSVANDTVTITGHGFLTGMKHQLSTTGTLPGGLATATDYYIIKVDDDTIKFATSQANATAGTAIDITSASGGGTHTVEVTTTVAGTVQLQKNSEPSTGTANWVDEGSSQSFTGATSINSKLSDIAYRQLRAKIDVTSGTVSTEVRCNSKGW